VKNLIRSIEGGYLHFNRVDHYIEGELADVQDGAELPLDQPGNAAATFERAPSFSLSDYYAQSRARTYACCFSLENSDHIWSHYGAGSVMGQVGLEFDLDRLRQWLNDGLSSSSAALMFDGTQCHQIFSINYGQAVYVARDSHRANTERAGQPDPVRLSERRSLRRGEGIACNLVGPGHGPFRACRWSRNRLPASPATAI
jgi:hypothetical protein